MKALFLTLILATAGSLAACATDSTGSYNDPSSPHYYPTDTENPSGTNFNPNSPGYNPGGSTDLGNMGRTDGGSGAVR